MKASDWEVRIQIEANEILFVLNFDDSLLAERGQDFFIFDELHQGFSAKRYVVMNRCDPDSSC